MRSDFTSRDVRLAKFLDAVPIFACLSPKSRLEMTEMAVSLSLTAGKWLFRENEQGEDLFLVCSGLLEVIRESASPPEIIQYLGPGEFVGELSLITEFPRSASVRAVRDSELLRVRRSDFEAIIAKHPDVSRGLLKGLGERLHQTLTAPPLGRRPLRVVALLPIAEHESVAAVIEAAARDLAERLDTRFVAPAPDDRPEDFPKRLREAEEKSELVVAVAVAAPRAERDYEWNRFIARQADRIVLLADIEKDRPIAPSDLQSPELLLVGRDFPLAKLSSWLEAVHPRAHHLIRTSDALPSAEDIGRFSRRLTGRAVGLVLSGGAARGMAHIGVIAALKEAGVVIDRFGGTSMGALIAAMAATGRSVEEMRDLAKDGLGRLFREYTVPIVSLLSGRNALDMLRGMVGEGRLEELTRPLFTVSSDLVSAGIMVHRSGETAEAVAASAAIPGILPPVRMNGRLLVDGCILNNLPTDVMAEDGEGPVIGSDVMANRHEFAERLASRQNRSGLIAMARGAILGEHSDLPDLPTVVTRSILLNSAQDLDEKRSRADLVIVSDCGKWGLFQFEHAKDFIEAGRAAAEKALAENPGFGREPAKTR